MYFGTSKVLSLFSLKKINSICFLPGLPSFILSGFVFPIKNMPVIIQAVTYAVPAKYMIYLIKGIVLKGVAASLMYMQILFMLIFAAAVLSVSIRKFRMTIE